MTVQYGWRPEDRYVVPSAPPSSPQSDPGTRAWRRRNLVAGRSVVTVVALVAGIAAWLAMSSDTRSPRAVAEAFLAANERHDWPASWDLLCAGERRAYGSLDRWSDRHDLVVESLPPFDEGLTTSVGTVRPEAGSTPGAYVVDVHLARGSSFSIEPLLVVEEDGDFRACGGA